MMITIHFDGGADPNPGYGYGSWLVVVNGRPWQQRSRTPLGNPITNNQAEYLTLIDCLKVVRASFQTGHPIDIFSDSELLVRQLEGQWKVKHPNMKPLAAHCRELLFGFNWRVAWNSRVRNVEMFGH